MIFQRQILSVFTVNEEVIDNGLESMKIAIMVITQDFIHQILYGTVKALDLEKNSE